MLYRQELKKAINQEDNNINRADYDVNLLDMIEEDRIIKGIHDVYGKLYDELGFDKLLYNPARNVASCKALKEIVLARVANPDSKRGFDKIYNPLKEKILNNDKKSCDLSIVLNEEKIEEDAVWDGLKGIVTNNLEISNEELIHQYSNLWQVEESFRITKHDLKIRPIY